MTDQPKTTDNLYHLILGLPEAVTSPNYYELLGLEGRTSDPQVIKDAATDQNRKLLHWQNSDRYAEVRALTFEVIQARDTLLNQESRDTYNLNLGDWGIADEGPWIVEEPPPPSSSEPLSVRCPECEAEFKLRNRDLIGRRIPCPECGFRFTVEPEEPETVVLEAEPLVEELDSDAELTALEDFDDRDDRPAAGSNRKARARSRRDQDRGDLFEVEPRADDYEDYESAGRRRSRSRERGRNRTGTATPPETHLSPSRVFGSLLSSKWIVLGGGGLMALGLLVLVVVFIQRMVSPSGSPATASERLAYLPPDCEGVAYYRLGDVARSPSFQDHLTRDLPLRQTVDQFRDRMGMELQEIDSMTIGLESESHLSRFRSMSLRNRLPSGLAFVAVVRSSKDWDRSKLIGEHTQSATHNGRTYHTFSPADRSQDTWAFYLADARTLLFGSLAEVQAAMDTGGNAPDWPDAEFLLQEYAIITTRLPGSPSKSPLGPRPSGRTPTRNGFHAEQLGTGISLEGNAVHLVSFLGCDSETEAANYIDQREQQHQQLRSRPFGGNTGGSKDRFAQHGRTVAVIGGADRTRIQGYFHGISLYAPLEMLARLGSGSSQAANRANPSTESVVSSRNTQTLDTMIVDLRNNRRVHEIARKLATMKHVPERQLEVAELLQNLIQDAKLDLTKLAGIEALGVWGGKEDVRFLLTFLDHENVVFRKRAVVALGQLKDPQGLPALVASLKDLWLTSEAKKALENFGAEAEPELLDALSAATDDWQYQKAICEVLNKVGTSRSLPQLDQLAVNGQYFVKSAAQSAADVIRQRK